MLINKNILDLLLDKILSKGQDSLTNLEKEFLSDIDNPKFKNIYFSMEQFQKDGYYKTKDGKSVKINGIDDGVGYEGKPYRHVRFILNEMINDMKDWDDFLLMMNGSKYSII